VGVELAPEICVICGFLLPGCISLRGGL
jgi:hypothetical protein